ncbi:TIGR02530 family flagellar biosynthesis protein [Carnobacterium sp.]|uniref:TIGR02530 family flagellar biosynthesis protein n=1 Tax=Carnobacterium sp. TaxID=48221 RepID=UPI0028B115D2|nr:TIGR02530 family flagellar biosynthesis protein [Carnobacterium sp.]
MSFHVSPIQNQAAEEIPIQKKPKIDRTFSAFLAESLKTETGYREVKLSNHAQKRMEERGFQLDQKDMTHLETAVEKLEHKGSKQSLILYKNMALIASINNRTIITALKTDEMETVTNIDSAMRIKQ